MYAIVDIAGKQYKVTKNQKIFVHRIEGDLGSSVYFDQVLLIENDKDVIVGEPVIQGALVSGRILSHAKGDKVKVFKKKRRKGYKVLKGHRQFFTELDIENIQEKGAVKRAQPATKPESKAAVKDAPKADTGKKAAEPKPTTKPAAEAKTTKTEPKTAAAKAPAKSAAKPAAKKPAAAKTTTKTTAKPKALKPTAAKPETAAKPAAKKTTGTTSKSAGTAKKPASGTKENKE
ncbi:MAG: 50S ribosomal protein L21 [Bacteroidales bacterium]|nr:50S ribosomal protein L21 [Bacteroidales bacterium]